MLVRPRAGLTALRLGLLALTWPLPGHAQSAAETDPPAAGPAPAAQTGAFGTLLGLRPWLAQYGATLSVEETAELLGDPSGGARQMVDFEGLATATLSVDLNKLLGLAGGQFLISAEQVHGRNLVTDALFDLHSNSSIENVRALRLWEMWYQQNFGPGLDVRVGEQGIDQEYMISTNSAFFLNANFGWPLLPSADLPEGGPIYPFGVPGIRLHAVVPGGVALLGGIYNGSPVRQGCPLASPPLCNPTGAQFPLDGGVLAIGEVQVSLPAGLLPGTYKLGGWYDSERQSVARFAAEPAGAPAAPSFVGDWSLYAVADQALWQQGGRSLGLFARGFMAPSDRNPVALELAGGLVLKAPWPGRPNDQLGVGVDYGQIGSVVRGLDLAAEAAGGYFARTEETVAELSYQISLTGWCQLQPDFQYVWNPGGGIGNPYRPSRRLANETVLGLRTLIGF